MLVFIPLRVQLRKLVIIINNVKGKKPGIVGMLKDL